MLGPFSMEAVVPGLQGTANFFNRTSEDVQIVLTAWLVGSALGQLFWGPVSDRIGRRNALSVAAFLFAVCSVACYSAQDFRLLLLGRLGQGLSAGAGSVTSKALVRDWYSGDRAVRLFGYLTSAVFLGPMIAPVLGGYLVEYFDWRSVYLFLAGWATLCFMVVLPGLTESLPPKARARKTTTPFNIATELFTNPQFRKALLIVLATGAGMFGFVTGSAELFLSELGVSPTLFGYLFLLIATGFVLGTKINSSLTNRSPGFRYRLGAAACLAGGVSLIILWSTQFDQLWPTVGACFLYYLGLGIVQPQAMGEALQPFPHMAGAASAWMGFGLMGAGALSSALVGRLHQETEVGMGILFLVGGMTTLWMSRK